MRYGLMLLLTALAAFAADEDAWARVRELKPGAELRIYKVNSTGPVSAKFDRATEESLIVVTRNGQLSIAKEDIDRLDCRRVPKRGLLKDLRTDRKVARKDAELTGNTIPGATTTVKTGLELPSRQGFEKIYVREPAGK